MNVRRALRLAWVVLCNGFLSIAAMKVLFPPVDTTIAVLAVIVSVGSAVGIAFEALRLRFAIAINVAIPTFVGVLMATSIAWVGSPSEAAEGAGFFVVLSVVPICLAIVTGLAYRTIDIEPERDSTSLGLQ